MYPSFSTTLISKISFVIVQWLICVTFMFRSFKHGVFVSFTVVPLMNIAAVPCAVVTVMATAFGTYGISGKQAEKICLKSFIS